MLAIVNFFIELALLRRAPQDLPAASALFLLVLLAGLATSLLLAGSARSSLSMGLLQSVLDLALMLSLVYIALQLTRHPGRFLQTATALVGADALIGLLALLPISLVASTTEGSGQYAFAGLLFLGLVVWSVVIVGHILRHAFALSLAQGAAIALTYKLGSLLIIGIITGTATSEG